MKKFTFLLLAIFFGHYTYSQIVITNTDVVEKGNMIIQSHDENPDGSIQPGEAGADMTWDFSALAGASSDTMALVEPSQTPFSDDFPMANLAIDISDSGYLYVERNDDRMALIGLAVEIDTLGEIRGHVDPPQSMVEFPLEYGNTFTGTSRAVYAFSYSQPGIDSIRYEQTTVESREADAWGQMTIPMGTYNVLRIHHTATVTDSIYVKSSVAGWMLISSNETETESYHWWSADTGTGYVIATLSLDASQDVMTATYMKSETSQGTHDLNASNLNVKVYPNPVENQLHVDFKKSFDGSVQIIDLTGRIIENKDITEQKLSFHFTDKSEGIYFYRIIDRESSASYTGKLIKR